MTVFCYVSQIRTILAAVANRYFHHVGGSFRHQLGLLDICFQQPAHSSKTRLTLLGQLLFHNPRVIIDGRASISSDELNVTGKRILFQIF
ncbi:hypothetical protein SDC9_130271 [bioreactor metagenome]|uniref:Uncharacterized protein n=1 Tax=bioreactor metagenome TaxID=1076179 RepID=A0A645D2C3_9ZZZZ